MAGILIVLGLYLIVFGFRSFRLTLAVGGFVTFGIDPSPFIFVLTEFI
jgi:hypothetical protein